MSKINRHSKKTNQVRQGDVLVLPVTEIPKNLVQTKIIRLANGEVTGHHHSIFSESAVGFAEEASALTEFMSVESPVELEHQEHATITLSPSKYRSVIQSEYTPEAIKRVQD